MDQRLPLERPAANSAVAMIAQAGSAQACFVRGEAAKELHFPRILLKNFGAIYFGCGLCAEPAAGDISAN